MAISDVLASIDRDLAQLRQARALLLDGTGLVAKKKAGRPKKVEAATRKVAAAPKKAEVAAKPAKKKKRNLSPEGRKRIAEAVKRRWANQKKEASSAK